MATKNEPGQYDCYKKAAEDEPLFTLRAKDPIAPYLVEIWHATRRGRWDEAVVIIGRAAGDAAVGSRVSSDNYDKLDEALAVADSMRAWFSLNVKPAPIGDPDDEAGSWSHQQHDLGMKGV